MSYIGYSKSQKAIETDLLDYINKLQKAFVVKEELSYTSDEVVAIKADAEAPTQSQDGYWQFLKENNTGANAGKKINWYFYGDLDGSQSNNLANLEAFYCRLYVDQTSDDPWLTAYTKAQGDGTDASWYNSRWNMTQKIGQLPKGEWVNLWFSFAGKSLAEVFPHLNGLTAVELAEEEMVLAGTGNKELPTFLIALSSNSGSSNMNIKLAEVGYKFANKMPQIIETH